MRFLVVGLGSMGKRRIRNLQYLKAGEIAGFDPREDRREEATAKYSIQTFGNFDEVIDVFRPDALIISTPPDLHVRYAKLAIANGRHFFSEASVVDDEMDELISMSSDKPNLVAAPSCTMRFHPSIQVIRDIVRSEEFGKPLLLTYQSGLWLPDWHPWEDYRSFYVAKRQTGACREIVPFELSWLTWLLGPVEFVTGMRGKLSGLDVDIDDAYQVLLQFRSGLLGHLLVDVIARAPVRSFRLCSEKATIEWDAMLKQVRVFRVDTREWETIPEPERIMEPGYITAENMYIEEMREFVAACEGKMKWSYSLEEDKGMLDLLSAVEKSWDNHIQVKVQ